MLWNFVKVVTSAFFFKAYCPQKEEVQTQIDFYKNMASTS